MDFNIIIAEDQEDLRFYTKKILESEGYSVRSASSGEEALNLLKEEFADLLLLDLNLGDIDGSEIIRILRNQGNDLPVMVISSFGQVSRKVDAFDLGCDDYITKPFIKEELLARIKRLRKRSLNNSGPRKAQEIFTSGAFEVDFGNCRVKKNGEEIILNRKLFEIFSFFIKNQNQVISKEQLLNRFWWDQVAPSENTLNVHIHMLREKIENNSRKPKYLKTKKGIGYYFEI